MYNTDLSYSPMSHICRIDTIYITVLCSNLQQRK